MEDTILTIVIAFVILFIVFLILRELNCWYWKINERINLQKEQNTILSMILQELKNDPYDEKAGSDNLPTSCPICQNNLNKGDKFCTNCGHKIS